MNNIYFDAYDKILGALIAYGYSEEESMSLICEVIEDQRNMDDFADNIYRIIDKELNSKVS